MGSILYEVLKEQADDINLKDVAIYYNLDEIIPISYTYLDLYNLVNKYITIFKELYLENERKFIIVDNSINSIAIFIALLQCKAIPILLNKKDVISVEVPYQENNSKFNYDKEFRQFMYDYILVNANQSSSLPELELSKVKKYISYISNFENSKKTENLKNNFYICTSGTLEGKPKLVLLNEFDVLKKTINDFKNTYGYNYYSYTSIANITGIIFNVILPIVLNNKNYFYTQEKFKDNFDTIFEDIFKYKINHFILPRNIFDYLPKKNNNLAYHDLKSVYLSGETNNYEIINKLRSIFNFRETDFVNLYGSTEAAGVISMCDERFLKPLYVHNYSFLNGNFIYTFDKKNIYLINFIDGISRRKKLDMYYEEEEFYEILPVSSNIIQNVEIKNYNYFYGEVFVNNFMSGDIGFYFENKLYILGRKKEIININEKQYFLPIIERIFYNLTGYKSSAIYNSITNKIFIAIDFDFDDLSIDNFKKVIPISKMCYKWIQKNDAFYPIEGFIFIPSNIFPYSKSMRKVLKTELLKFSDKLTEFNYNVNNYQKAIQNKIKHYLFLITRRNFDFQINGNKIIINKRNISFDEFIELLKYCGFINFEEIENTFSVEIDDSILFDVFPSFNEYKLSNEKIQYFKKKYREHNNFSKYFNRYLSRNKKYTCLKLIGNYIENDKEVIFQPFQITTNNNWGEDEILVNKDKIKLEDFNLDDIKMIYLESSKNTYYDDEILLTKLEEYKNYLNHTYIVSKNLEYFYIDGHEACKEEKILYSKLINDISIFFSHTILKSHMRYNIDCDNIVFVTEIFSPVLNFTESFSYFYDFDIIGFQKKYFVENQDGIDRLAQTISDYFISSNLQLEYYPIIIYDMEYAKINNQSLMSIVNENKVLTMKRLFDKLRKYPKKEYFDFSKIRLIYLINDPILYKNSTKEQMKLLNYSRSFCDIIDDKYIFPVDIEKIEHMIKGDDVNEHKSKSL